MVQKRIYRRMIRKGDPRISIVMPEGLQNALLNAAKKNGRKFSQEIIARLAVSLEKPDVMLHDRLMRLIFVVNFLTRIHKIVFVNTI